MCVKCVEMCGFCVDMCGYLANFLKISHDFNSNLANKQAVFTPVLRKRKVPKSLIYQRKRDLRRLEAPPRFELGDQSFADSCLTTWLWRHINFL